MESYVNGSGTPENRTAENTAAWIAKHFGGIFQAMTKSVVYSAHFLQNYHKDIGDDLSLGSL
jgi:hypothetical protein